jgi:hypothetical protein
MLKDGQTAEEEVNEPDPVVEEQAVVDSVQAKLDVLNGVEPEEKDDNQTEEQEPKKDSTPEEKDDNQAEEKDDDGESTSEEKAAAEKDDGTDVTLPDNFYRAAIHQGWTPEEVKEFFEATPELAVKSFGKMYESTNKLSSEFARIGRLKLEGGKPEAKTATEESEEKAKVIDTAALIEQYGEDSAVVKAFTALSGRLEAAEAAVPVAPAKVEANPEAEAVAKQFFSNPALKPYAEFYGEGNDADKLTHGQMKHRWEMFEQADCIILGAEAQGLSMSIDEAMEKAHMSVTDGMREQAIRTELKAKIVKRSKGLSLKPSSGKSAKSDENAPKTEKQLEATVGARLGQIYRK